jgi:heme exporter protein D
VVPACSSLCLGLAIWLTLGVTLLIVIVSIVVMLVKRRTTQSGRAETRYHTARQKYVTIVQFGGDSVNNDSFDQGYLTLPRQNQELDSDHYNVVTSVIWNGKQAQKRPKVFGWAQIISLLNIEQNCDWVDLNLAAMLAHAWHAWPRVQLFQLLNSGGSRNWVWGGESQDCVPKHYPRKARGKNLGTFFACL